MIDPIDAVTLALPVTAPQTTRLRFASGLQVYTVVLVQDLFGDWMLMQSWDGKRNQRGGGQVRQVDSFEAGLAALEVIRKTRNKLGYQAA